MRVQKPPAQAGAIVRHHGDLETCTLQGHDPDAPGAFDKDVGPAVARHVLETAELVVAGVEQPAAETRTIGGEHDTVDRSSRPCENSDPPRTGDQEFVPAVSIEVCRCPDPVVEGIEEPSTKARAVGGHRQRGKVVTGELKQAQSPRASDDKFVPPVTIEITDGPKPVIRSVQEPATEARPVGSHHHGGKRAAGELENTNTPRTRDQDLFAPISIEIADRAEMVVCGIQQPAAKARSVGGHHQRLEGITEIWLAD